MVRIIVFIIIYDFRYFVRNFLGKRKWIERFILLSGLVILWLQLYWVAMKIPWLIEQNDPFSALVNILFIYFSIDFLSRLLLSSHLSIAPSLLLLNIKKGNLVSAKLLLKIFNPFNVTAMFFFVPLAYSFILPVYGKAMAVSLILFVLLIVLFETFLSVFFKMLSLKSIFFSFLVYFFLAGLILPGVREHVFVFWRFLSAAIIHNQHSIWLCMVGAVSLFAFFDYYFSTSQNIRTHDREIDRRERNHYPAAPR